MDIKLDIVTQINKLCNQHDISLHHLEHQIKIGNGAISKWDKSSPKVSNLYKVANYFNVSIDELIGKTGVINIDKSDDQPCGGVQKFETIIAELSNQKLTFQDKPVDAEMVEFIKKMLTTNLEFWVSKN